MPTQNERARLLQGWKEISDYLRVSVRTAHRWHRVAGMPVRRRQIQRGWAVYAVPSEIDAWLRESEGERARGTGIGPTPAVAGDSDSTAPPARSSVGMAAAAPRRSLSTTARRSVAVFFVAVLATVAVALGGRTFPSQWWNATTATADFPQPSSWRVDGERLTVSDASGERLWEFTAPFVLDEGVYRGSFDVPTARLAQIMDVDGDARSEVLLLAQGKDSRESALYCFDHQGEIAFAHRATSPAQFGDTLYEPPFVASQFLVTRDSNGQAAIWLVSLHHLWFPAVVEKLTPDGKVLARYWSNGHIRTLAAGRLGDRRVLFVGATNNEHRAASLAVIDYDSPSGAAPAEDPRFECLSCLPGQPLAFLLFPALDLWRQFDVPPYVTDVQSSEDGTITVHVRESESLPTGRPIQWTVYYLLNSNLDMLEVRFDEDYRRAHLQLELLGRLGHRFGDVDHQEALQVLR